MRVRLQTMKNEDDMESLRDLVARKTTLCYRDPRGRKVFGTADALPEDDHLSGADTEVSMTAVHYDEAI